MLRTRPRKTAPCAAARKSAPTLVPFALVLLLASPAGALHPHVPFPELVHASDAIFVGVVTDVESRFGRNGVIVTDVTLEIEELVHAGAAVAVDLSAPVVLTFAGGQIGDHGLTVSGVPDFAPDHRYVVFTRLDGQPYMNPLVGGAQGLFTVLADTATGAMYPTTPGGLALAAVRDARLEYTARIAEISGGVAAFAPDEFVPAPPGQPAAGSADSAADTLRATAPVHPLTLAEFMAEITAELQRPAPPTPALCGVWNTTESPPERGRITSRPLAPADPPQVLGQSIQLLTPAPGLVHLPADDVAAPATPPVGTKSLRVDGPAPEDPAPGAPPADDQRAALCYCGAFNLFLVMEQVPVGWWEWGENNYSMALFNQFMDIYRYVPDDGSYGNNGQNEFGGYPSSQDLMNIYGQGWNGELAVTWTFWSGCECCTITQADVFFNPAYSWWQNFSDTFNQGGRVLYRPVIDHELGHTWGMQRGSCTEDYSYSQISVMHAYYSNIVEDGYGIHHPEAWSIRQLYQGQTGVIPRQDVGVESYYASGSLINTSTDWSWYYPGDPITISNITVENNSNTATPGVRLRFFLSTNNVISPGDYQMGSYWYWDWFGATTYSTGTYTTTVPSVPPGIYYVGAIVSTNGDAYAGDDINYNNATYLAATVEIRLPPPTNDSCWSAAPVGLGTYFGTTGGAGNDGAASCGSSGSTADVWYSFTAPCAGNLAVDTCGSSYDTVLSIHTGCWGSPANELDCDDDCATLPCGLRDSCVTAPVEAGQTYLIRVSGYAGATGAFVLNVSYGPPDNDACAAASAVADGATAFSTCGATTDGPDEPAACLYFGYSQIDADAWYVYTASCTGDATVSLCGSAYDTKLAVYTDCPSAGGTLLACNDDACGYQSELTFSAVASTPYWIRIGGYLGATGAGTLSITCGGGTGVVFGDMNCDGLVDFGDINPFVLYLSNYATWEATYPGCPAQNGDCNNDGTYPSFGDINPFVSLLTGG